MTKAEPSQSNRFYAKDRKAWRNWLKKKHADAKNVWMILYHKKNKKPSITYYEAVEEALCFGWIDSKPNKRDDESSYLFLPSVIPKATGAKQITNGRRG